MASNQPPGVSSVTFGGRNPRDILTSFYTTRNPAKLAEVDKTLAKYAGREQLLFLNLAKKYNVDPSDFGVNAAQNTIQSPASGFGTSSQGFGAPSFGSPAPLGGGFGSSVGGFGSPSGGVFGGGGGGSTFGSLAQQGMGGSASPFGNTTATFGAPRR